MFILGTTWNSSCPLKSRFNSLQSPQVQLPSLYSQRPIIMCTRRLLPKYELIDNILWSSLSIYYLLLIGQTVHQQSAVTNYLHNMFDFYKDPLAIFYSLANSLDRPTVIRLRCLSCNGGVRKYICVILKKCYWEVKFGCAQK